MGGVRAKGGERMNRAGTIWLVVMVATVFTGCSDWISDPDDGIIGIGRPMYPPIWDMPIWSPDGGTIACFCQGVYGIDSVSGCYQIDFDKRGFYLMNPDGSNMRKVSDYEIGTPSWHPNGDSLVFALFPYGGAIAKADTSMDSLILLTEVDWFFNPRWSPDGKRILFSKAVDPDAGLWIMDSDGGGKRQLCVASRGCWSATGDTIAAYNIQGIVLVDSFGETICVLPTLPFGDPVDRIDWCAQNNVLFYDVAPANRIYKYSFTHKKHIELASTAAYPSLSPDGKHVVFLRHSFSWFSPNNGHLYVMDSDGSNQHQITFSEGGDSLR